MFSQKTSKQGSALLIGLLITLLLSVVVIGFLEKVLRSGRNTKSIEQSTQAYYNATSLIEEQLQKTTNLKKSPWEIEEISSDAGKLEVFAKSSNIPYAKKGNGIEQNSSEGSDYNIISLQNPIQLAVPDVSWNDVKIYFRIPRIDALSNQENISVLNPIPDQGNLLLWSISNDKKILFANSDDPASLFSDGDINKDQGSAFVLRNGYFFDSNNEKKVKAIADFATQDLGNCDNYSCMLKISLLKPVKVQFHGQTMEFPFLEYKIDFGSGQVPDQNITLEATGYQGEYLRERKVSIPQITTNTALDFAILQ